MCMTLELRLQTHSSEKKASKFGAEKYLRVESAATSSARMVSRSAWPSIGLWEEEEDVGRGKRLCMGLGSPAGGETRPALSTTPAGSTNAHNSLSYEPGNDDFVPGLFPDFPSQARSSRLGVDGWATVPGDGFESSDALEGHDLFQSHQSAPWSSQMRTNYSTVVQDAVQPSHFDATTSPGFACPTSVAHPLGAPRQSAVPTEDLGGQYHVSGVDAMDTSAVYEGFASRNDIAGVILSKDYSEAAGSVVQTSEDRLCLGMVGNGHGFGKAYAEIH